MLATAFPLTSVLVAAERTLPSDVSIGEIPMDTRWLPGNRIEVPLLRDGVAATLTVTVTVLPGQEVCAAASDLLSEAEEDAVADEVCAVWEDEGACRSWCPTRTCRWRSTRPTPPGRHAAG